MFGGEVIRHTIQFAAFCNQVLGSEAKVLIPKYVPPRLINIASVDYSRVDDTQKIHEIISTDDPCKVLTRKRACFCRHCLDFRFEDCQNEDASPVVPETIRQGNAGTQNSMMQLLLGSTKP
jgi:hypothetical protein